MTAQDLTALADKLDERALDIQLRREEVALQPTSMLLQQAATALREAARLREVEKITLMLASFKDPRTVSCPDEELELFAKIIEDAKAIHGDLHEDEEPGHGA